MGTNTRILKAYLNHFLPRDVVGPVIIVFSLEGVIGGIFTQYVPTEYETLGWGVVFLFSIVIVAYWGSVDKPALAELEERLEEIEAEIAEIDAEDIYEDLVGDGQSHVQQLLRDGRYVVVALADGGHERVLLTGDEFLNRHGPRDVEDLLDELPALRNRSCTEQEHSEWNRISGSPRRHCSP